jgi:hypothetical protein
MAAAPPGAAIVGSSNQSNAAEGDPSATKSSVGPHGRATGHRAQADFMTPRVGYRDVDIDFKDNGRDFFYDVGYRRPVVSATYRF